MSECLYTSRQLAFVEPNKYLQKAEDAKLSAEQEADARDDQEVEALIKDLVEQNELRKKIRRESLRTHGRDGFISTTLG